MSEPTRPQDSSNSADLRAKRDRFLSDFSLELVGTEDQNGLLGWAVARIGRLLSVDRVGIFLFEGPPEEGLMAVRATWNADGVTHLPESVASEQSESWTEVLQSRAPILAADALADPALASIARWLERLGTKSLLAVPVLAGERILGFVSAASVRVSRVWTPEEAAFLQSAARHVAAALKQGELLDELSLERERLSVLLDLAAAVQRSATPDEVIRTALGELRNTLGFRAAIFGVLSPSGEEAISAGYFAQDVVPGAPLPDSWRWRIAPSAGRPREVATQVLESGKAIVIDDVESDPRAAASRAVFRRLGIGATAVFPMRAAGHVIGVMSVGGPAAEWDVGAEDVELLQSLADFVGVALEQRRVTEALERSNRLKDDFLANLSHEVRTPLTGIVGWTEVLLDNETGDPDSRHGLEAILAQATTLSRMLSDLIDLSRIDNLGLEIRRTGVRIGETIAAALDTVTPAATKKGVPIVCDVAEDLPEVNGDPARLQQVIWNLLTNAVKFSPPGNPVRVAARTSNGGGVELVVEDEGSGIDPVFLPHVFDRFRQEESSSSRRYGGLGVGLSIARAIVEAHDGTIEAASEGRNRGARFRVLFPPPAARSGP
ncbi:MAG: GAF domain-containing protein [Thermoanaerobaculia bacterium]